MTERRKLSREASIHSATVLLVLNLPFNQANSLWSRARILHHCLASSKIAEKRRNKITFPGHIRDDSVQRQKKDCSHCETIIDASDMM